MHHSPRTTTQCAAAVAAAALDEKVEVVSCVMNCMAWSASISVDVRDFVLVVDAVALASDHHKLGPERYADELGRCARRAPRPPLRLARPRRRPSMPSAAR